QTNDLERNEITYTLAINACAAIVNIDEGKKIHQYINTNDRLKSNIIIQNTLIDMYNKCGDLNQSIQIFNNIIKPNIITYGAMMKAYLDHNNGKKAFKLYQNIKQTNNLECNEIIYTLAISSCSHIVNIDEGKK